MRFVDTNILLRHLTQDDPVKAQACTALLRDIGQGRIQAWTTELVVAELAFVLASKGPNSYSLTRRQIAQGLLPLLNLPGLHLPSKVLYPRIFELYTAMPIDFIDAYHIAQMESISETELYSYDTDFDRVEGIKRIEP